MQYICNTNILKVIRQHCILCFSTVQKLNHTLGKCCSQAALGVKLFEPNSTAAIANSAADGRGLIENIKAQKGKHILCLVSGAPAKTQRLRTWTILSNK